METICLLGKDALGTAGAEDYVDWATAQLMQGAESENLAILAGLGLERAPDSEEVRNYFRRSLDDLGLSLPSRDRALLDYARHLCTGIVEGRLDPRESLKYLERLFPASDYLAIHGIWDKLIEDIAFLIDEGRCYFNTGLNRSNIDRYIQDVARQFLVLTEIELPEDFFRLYICLACGHFGVPGSERVRRSVSVKGWFRQRYKTVVDSRTVCPRCGKPYPLSMDDFTARKRYLETLGIEG